MKHTLRTGAGVLALACLSLVLVAGTAGAVVKNTTIRDIRTLNGIALNDTVAVDSVVVIGVDIRPSTYGIYLEERTGGRWGGILYYLSGTYPGYANSADPVAVGDLISVQRGVYTEFASGAGSLSEINMSLSLKPLKLGTVTPLAPVVMPVDSLKDSYPGSEAWEGCLVRVDSVKVTSLDTYRNWRFHEAHGPSAGRVDSIMGYEKMITGQIVPQVGDLLGTVTGVLDWANGTRKIAPRNSDDIVFLSAAPPPVPMMSYSTAENKVKVRFTGPLDPTTAENKNNYSLSTLETINTAVYDPATKSVLLTTATNLVPSTTAHVLTVSNVKNNQGVPMPAPATNTFVGGISTIVFVQTPRVGAADTSQVNGLRVSMRGVCTEQTGVDLWSGIGGFYMQQRGAATRGGIFIYGSPINPARNDSVFVTGIVAEFGIGPETEITPVAEVSVIASGRPPIQPVVVTPAQINYSNPATADMYEEMLVKLSNVKCVSNWGAGNPPPVGGIPFWAVSGTDTMRVDDLAVDQTAYGPWMGDRLDVIGITRVLGTLPHYRLEPRNWNEPPVGDIHLISRGRVSDALPVAYRTQLLQNEPNPFNPSTKISFTLAHEGQATLRIYDVRGKLVTTLLNGKAAAGPNVVVWDGRTAKGRAAETGVYFYRLRSGDVTQTKKMVLLK